MNNNKTGGTAECSGREIKFRYRVKYNHSETGAVVMKTLILPIGELEDGALGAIPGTDIHILSRDQFTGLHDKNGVEIYDKYITQYGNRKYVVRVGEYNNGATDIDGLERGNGWYLEHIPSDPPGTWSYHGILSLTTDIANKVEVIGDRFENPELLEETN